MKKVFGFFAVNICIFQFQTPQTPQTPFLQRVRLRFGKHPLETGMTGGKLPAMVATGNHVVEVQPVKGWPVTGA
ncbi:hypothetical protein [Acidocella aquatica]|uniref:hypothetical protein n=1 Tax=Acidocella aquatica TaxID=1922313 RepID=UPI0024E1779E|nr:hypothetical protein [Acidocella aquatica]